MDKALRAAADEAAGMKDEYISVEHLFLALIKTADKDLSPLFKRLNVSESDVSYAMVMMKETIEYFITSYDKAIEEVQDKNPKIITVTSDEICNAANRLKHEGEKVGRPRRQSD